MTASTTKICICVTLSSDLRIKFACIRNIDKWRGDKLIYTSCIIIVFRELMNIYDKDMEMNT